MGIATLRFKIARLVLQVHEEEPDARRLDQASPLSAMKSGVLATPR